jgi:hypothetical protein
MNKKDLKKFDEMKDHLLVTHKGKNLYYLSFNLALEQKITVEDLDKITALHNELQDLFDEMRECSDKSILPSYVKKVEDIEFRMQEAWKFNKDSNFHSWWYKAPHCECPQIDNGERFGTGYRVIDMKCPVHGGILG